MTNEWLIIIVPIVAYLVAQGVKLAFDGIKGNTDIYHMWTMYGGMPSAHSAFVVSLATFIGLKEGFASVPFAIVAVFAILAIRDAIGFRRQLGDHAKLINILIEKLPEKDSKQYVRLGERIGHSPLEAFVGSVFGAGIAILSFYFL